MFAWLLAVEIGAEVWYRFREGNRAASLQWRIQWPIEGEGFQFRKVPDEAREVLRFSEGYSADKQWDDGSAWQIFFFRWEPGKSSIQLATMHRPEICLPAAGFKFRRQSQTAHVTVDDARFDFDGSVFESNGSPIYIFRCLWDDQPAVGSSQSRVFDMSVAGRLEAAWYGQRNLGQRLLQVGIRGVSTESAAANDLKRKLPEFIRVDG